ncbi:MAG TPA: hypothetical protein VFB80_02220, partial [Pirellulaceae bacterium]|nr:hypothetical protein [Pirellulaceae bacterium]
MLSQHASSLLVLAGVGLAVYLLLRSSAKRRQEQADEDQRPLAKASTAAADAPADVLRWQIELYETARDLKAEIDTKFAALQALALLARQESQRLETALARVAEVTTPHARHSLAAIESLGDSAQLDNRERLPAVAAQMPTHNDLRGALFDDNRDLVAVANLADQGLSAPEIARRL